MSEFEKFWNLYDKKVKRKRCLNKWLKLNTEEKQKIFNSLPKYIESTPNKQYRMHPSTYLNNESWNDEIIDRSKPVEEQKVMELNG